MPGMFLRVGCSATSTILIEDFVGIGGFVGIVPDDRIPHIRMDVSVFGRGLLFGLHDPGQLGKHGSKLGHIPLELLYGSITADLEWLVDRVGWWIWPVSPVAAVTAIAVAIPASMGFDCFCLMIL